MTINPYESPQSVDVEPTSLLFWMIGHTYTAWEVEQGRYPRRWKKCSRCGLVKGKHCNHEWYYNDFVWRRDCTLCEHQETFGT